MKMLKFRSAQGFTLVEIAISLLIIGLLTAGVVKGREVVEIAQMSGLLSGLEATTKAHVSFVNVYGELPGDIDAPYVVPGCEADNTNFCFGGNQDGAIGTIATTSAISTSSNVEHAMYWKHLVLGGFYTGLDPTIDVRNNVNMVRGETHPMIYRRTVLDIVHMTRSGCAGLECNEGPTYRLQPDFFNYTGAIGEGAMKPLYAQRVDRKLDDGMPDTGMVQAEAVSSECDAGRIYNIDNDSYNCVMFFQISP
ncbi:MAG: hypothetical protein CL570_07165 [Alphaproteobacteria bacterium]|nr:hypothetical protein [Alphaproteobacteria bacterium]HCQ71568.1 hypothetical protein [Rhodospirillaceae bacterium]